MSRINLLNRFFVTPGDLITDNEEDLALSLAGEGTYIQNGKLYSTLTGFVETKTLPSGQFYLTVNCASSRCFSSGCDATIDVDNVVLCYVTKIQVNQVLVDIVAIKKDAYEHECELNVKSKGIIRREDIRQNEIDKIVMGDCFQPGDIVRAKVLSLGDARQYYLSTAASQFGVLWAVHAESGNIMTPVNWKVLL
jgi:exosome complex RNA-binding protein Csl4